MLTIEVKFNPDERALLDLLQTKAKPDGMIGISDTALLAQLGMDTAAFFAAKMRLVTAGVLALHVDGLARQVIQLNMPEHPHPKAPSRRYVFTVVPLECLHDIRRVIGSHRAKMAPKAGEGSAPKAGAGEKHAAPGKPVLRDYAVAQKRGMQRLGVHFVPQQPIRPPLKSVAK